MKNKWRTAFLTLAAIIIVIIAVITFSIIKLTETDGKTVQFPHDTPKVTAPIFMVQANKERLAAMINHELQKHQTGNLSYGVDLTNDVTLDGALNVLGLDIPFDLSFDPVVKDGDIILKETGVKLGDINLPDQEVLKFIDKGTDLPEWITVEPDKKQIYVDLTAMDLKEHFYLKAKKMDMANNQIEFNVYRK
jgi:uncharacterized protein YpmS